MEEKTINVIETVESKKDKDEDMQEIDYATYLKNHLINSNIYLDEPMSKHTTMGVGGPCECFIVAKSQEDIEKVVEFSKEYDLPLYILGRGSNCIFTDKGYKGIVLKISSDFGNIEVDGENIKVQSGCMIAKVARYAMENGLSGLEFASNIPGSIGGAIRMNAGAFGGEMKDIVIETEYIDENGEIKRINNKQHEFSYRTSIFKKNPKLVVINTTIKLKPRNKEEIKRLTEEISLKRKESQPYDYPSSGSVFKRMDGVVVSKLIDEAGLKGYTIGGAQVSYKHAGFIVNTGNAKASDVISLIDLVKQKIKEKYNINIETEVEIVGEQ